MAEYVYAVRLYTHLRIEDADSDSAQRAVTNLLDTGQLPIGEYLTLGVAGRRR